MKKIILLLASVMGVAMASQAQVTKTLSVVPGGLYKALTYDERVNTTHLILSGTMDARDFVTMRDNMKNLEVIDLTKVRIEAYEGDKGTEINTKSNSVKGKYAENTIPQYAFFKNGNGSGARKLQKVIYPKNTVAVGYKAFYACYNLTEVSFPASVKELAAEAFYNCKSLVSITVEGNAPIAKMGKGVFFAVDPSTCVVNVQPGTKDAFSSAKQWSDFSNIEEIQPAE